MNDRTPSEASYRRTQAENWAARSNSEACSRCGVRGDVDCQHRPGSGQSPAAIMEASETPKKPDGRERKALGEGGRHRQFPSLRGLNFKRKGDER